MGQNWPHDPQCQLQLLGADSPRPASCHSCVLVSCGWHRCVTATSSTHQPLCPPSHASPPSTHPSSPSPLVPFDPLLVRCPQNPRSPHLKVILPTSPVFAGSRGESRHYRSCQPRVTHVVLDTLPISSHPGPSVSWTFSSHVYGFIRSPFVCFALPFFYP